MKIWVSGTIAFDIILDYPGIFSDQIDPKKLHSINLSFPVPEVKKTKGGTAGNIAYNLKMLGMEVGIIGAVGEDGQAMLRDYKKSSIDVSLIKASKKHNTPTAYIMTDQHDNQINAFYGGAMNERAKKPKVAGCDWPIIAPENPENMTMLAEHYQKHGKKYIFDPGQAIFVLNKRQLVKCLRGASILIGNDYEIEQVAKKSGLKRFKQVVYKTLGPKGTEIVFPNGEKKAIKAVKTKDLVDPTGAGDAYRAGLVKGISSGFDLVQSAQVASTAAVFAVESYGTQEHKFNYDIIVKRHNQNYNHSKIIKLK